MTSFLRNVWYMAGWSEDIGDTLLARTLIDIPVLLYRRQDGAVAALHDQCPHRFAPLSMGRRFGDVVECVYHGLRFDDSGACVHNPYSEKTASACRVTVFPVVERHTAAWIWFGDPAAADPDLIPDLAFLVETPESRVQRLTLHFNANYEIGVDNLLDLSHIQFVHPTTFGNDAIASGEYTLRQEGRTLHSNRWCSGGVAPAGFARAAGGDETLVDLWHEMRWDAPATMALDVGAAPMGRPRAEGMHALVAHVLTPESADKTHYFIGSVRWWAVDSAEADEATDALNRKALEGEDKPILEAVQRRMAGRDLFEMGPVLLPGDAGGVRARRLLRQLIAEEQAAVTEPVLQTDR